MLIGIIRRIHNHAESNSSIIVRLCLSKILLFSVLISSENKVWKIDPIVNSLSALFNMKPDRSPNFLLIRTLAVLSCVERESRDTVMHGNHYEFIVRL